jgi:hypothetical protein
MQAFIHPSDIYIYIYIYSYMRLISGASSCWMFLLLSLASFIKTSFQNGSSYLRMCRPSRFQHSRWQSEILVRGVEKEDENSLLLADDTTVPIFCSLRG